MIDVLKYSTLFLEQLIWLLQYYGYFNTQKFSLTLRVEKISDFYELEVVDFSVSAEVPGSAVSIIASQVLITFWQTR